MRRAAVRAGAAGPRARRRTGRRPARARAAGRTRARWRLAAAVPLTRAAVGLEEMWRCALSAVRALPHELLFCIGGEEATVWGVNKRKFLSASPRASLLYRW